MRSSVFHDLGAGKDFGVELRLELSERLQKISLTTQSRASAIATLTRSSRFCSMVAVQIEADIPYPDSYPRGFKYTIEEHRETRLVAI